VRKYNFSALGVQELVDRFTLIGLAQDEALLCDEYSKFNRLFWEMDAVEAELKSRSGDKRRALMPLYEHPNPQVRLTAIKATLAVEPVEARRQLEILATSGEYPQSGDAGMSIYNLDAGIFKPT
jgi:hypothetical protein